MALSQDNPVSRRRRLVVWYSLTRTYFSTLHWNSLYLVLKKGLVFEDPPSPTAEYLFSFSAINPAYELIPA